MRTNLARASMNLAAGSVVSRILGFLKVVLLVRVIGQVASPSADAFGVANQLPNNIYALVAGGVLSAVLVPHIVRALRTADNGVAYINGVVTVGVIIFGILTVVVAVAAPTLVALYTQPGAGKSGFGAKEMVLAISFAYLCVPQVFFYALYSLIGEVLNARQMFGAFSWAPVVNNVVAIAGLIVFYWLYGGASHNSPVEAWTPDRIWLLAGSATLGVVVQATVLVLFWRRSGLTYRPSLRWKSIGLGASGRASGWLFGMILATQIAGVVQTRVASLASGSGASVLTLQNAWLIFMLPHGVITVSIATPYFTRMSGHAANKDLESVRSDLGQALRAVGVLMMIATATLVAVSFPLARVFQVSYPAVSAMAFVLLAYLPGLVAFSCLFVIQRTFYSLGDTRTPFLFQCAQSLVFVIGATICASLPSNRIAVGIAALTSVLGIAQTIVAAMLLRRKLNAESRGRFILRRFAVYGTAALLAMVAGVGVVDLFGGFNGTGFAQGGIASALIVVATTAISMGGLYFAFLWLVRAPELAGIRQALLAAGRRLRG